MSVSVIAALALSVGFAAAVQTALGFGFGLVLVPLLLGLGRSLPDAVTITLGASLWQTSLGLYSVRSEIRWKAALPLALAQWVSLPLGLAAMELLSSGGPGRVKQGVGVVLLAVLTMRLRADPRPRDAVPRSITLAAALSSGFLSGAVGMGGPPLVLLALAQRLSPDRYRAYLWEQFLMITPVQLAVLTARFGMASLTAFATGFVLAPALFLGTFAGRAISARWDSARLARAAIAMLYLLAILSMLAPFLERA